MGNLRREAKKILLDSSLVDANLVTAITGGVLISEYKEILLEDVCGCIKVCADAGALKAELIRVQPQCPCDECDTWEGGITIEKPNRTTGFFKDHNVFTKYYGHHIQVIRACSNGLLHVEDIEEITAQIVEMIYNDEHSIVDAAMAARFDWTAGIPVIQIHDMQNNLIDTITAGGASIADLVTALVGNTYLSVYESAADYILLHTNYRGYRFTVTNLTKGQTYYGIGVVANDVNVQYVAQVDRDFGYIWPTAVTEGRWPKLTWRDIARIFPVGISHIGTVRPGVVRGGEYCMYKFKLCHTAYDHTFANHMNDYDEEVEFYGLKSDLEGAHFEDKLVDAGLTVDCDGYESESPSPSPSPSP